ncbi:MAG: hypothetical protein EOP83_27585, partial [Verrucomicrobiaceae bacterium]
MSTVTEAPKMARLQRRTPEVDVGALERALRQQLRGEVRFSDGDREFDLEFGHFRALGRTADRGHGGAADVCFGVSDWLGHWKYLTPSPEFTRALVAPTVFCLKAQGATCLATLGFETESIGIKSNSKFSFWCTTLAFLLMISSTSIIVLDINHM